MNRVALFTVALLFSTHLAAQLGEAAVADVLDRYHRAAATADWDVCFDLLSEDAVFLGTDVSERWPKAVFREYAGGRSSWTYTTRERHINLTPDCNSAWFDEVLDSQNYVKSRGTGVLIKIGSDWKI